MLDGNYTVEDLDNYFHRFHINTAWTVLTNILAIYLVCTKTTKEMGNYKYYLLLTLFCPMIMDLHISVFFGIFMAMPVAGHCAAGLTRYLGYFFGSKIQYGVMHETVSWTGVSLLIGFLYRYYSIKGEIERFHKKRNIILIPLILLAYPIPSITTLYYAEWGYTYDERIQFVQDHVPQYYTLYKEFKVCNVITSNLKAGIYLLTAIIQIIIVYTGYLVVSIKIMRLLKEVKSSLTAATYALQKQLFTALVFQCIIPLIFLAGPMWILMIIVLVELPYAGGKNIY